MWPLSRRLHAVALPAFRAWCSIPASGLSPRLQSPFFISGVPALRVLSPFPLSASCVRFPVLPDPCFPARVFLFFLKKERECSLFPAIFVYLQAISCVHARKTCKTDCRLRYQYHCRKVPELSAHALLYPYFRAGDLWRRHGYLRPDPAGAHAADDGYGVELFPFLGQSRGGGRRREGRQTQAFCHDMGRHLACRRRFLCRRRLLPRRDFAPDGRGLCGTSRIHRLGRAHHPVRRLVVPPLLTAARAGAGDAVRRAQGDGRRAQCRPGRGIRPRRAFFHRVRRGVGLRRQPYRQCRDVAGNPRHRRPHCTEDQLGSAGRCFRLFAAVAHRRAGGYGQRVHRPPADQIPRARRGHGRAGGLRRYHQDRRGDDAFLPDVPPCRRAVLPLELQKVRFRADERRGAEILCHGLDADLPGHRPVPRPVRADRGTRFPRRDLHPPGRARGQRADGRVAQPLVLV